MALPTGYTAVDYIQSTGTQYILLTQTVQNTFQHVKIDAAPTASGNSLCLFGSFGETNFTFYFGSNTSSLIGATSRFAPGTGNSYLSGATVGQRVVLEKKQNPNNADQVILLADGSVMSNGTMTATGGYTTTQHPYLFAANRNGEVYNRGYWRVYDAVIYDNNENEAVHLVPARRTADGKLGLYDIVNNSFFTNNGTGEFQTNSVYVDPPSSISVSSGITVGSSISVVWSASGSSGVTGYVLQRSVDGGAFGQVYSGTSLSYTDTALSGWTSVQYRVRAAIDSDTSEWVTSPARTVSDPSNPASVDLSSKFEVYLKHLEKPFRKAVRLEFLQPDDTVAFALGGEKSRTTAAGRDTRTFLQSGSVSVNLQNGQRRRASITLGNRDGAFDFAVNKLWFGQRLRLLMGMRLPNGEDFLFPMGVFYIENPSVLFSPAEKTVTLNLTDKWAYLDGSLFGTLEAAYSVPLGTNIFTAADSILKLSKYTYTAAAVKGDRIDPTDGVYTSYYNGKTYTAAHSDGSITSDIAMTDTPYTLTENRGSTFGSILLTLNEMLAGWIGYDSAGALRIEPSQTDTDDADKPVLFTFTPENSTLLSLTESSMVSSVYNDVTVAGQGLTNATVWARAVNADPMSDTNINLIGRRIFVEEKADYWNTDQCAALARFYLKRKSILQKSVTVECGQMFHLLENRLISVKRTDKPGSPVEKHLIQGFTVPVEETGSMSINCVSVNDIPDFTITTSTS